jgi:hypothetical protein
MCISVTLVAQRGVGAINRPRRLPGYTTDPTNLS